MTEQYTPTTEQVRRAYEIDRVTRYANIEPHEPKAEFYRWLAEVKAEAWNEGRDAEAATWNTEIAGTAINPHERAISSDSRSLG